MTLPSAWKLVKSEVVGSKIIECLYNLPIIKVLVWKGITHSKIIDRLFMYGYSYCYAIGLLQKDLVLHSLENYKKRYPVAFLFNYIILLQINKLLWLRNHCGINILSVAHLVTRAMFVVSLYVCTHACLCICTYDPKSLVI